MADAAPHASDGGALRRRLRVGTGSGVLVVVFSQVRVPDGKFGLERLFAATRHHCLFLNQPDNGWYRGLAADIDAAIAEAIAAVQPENIIFYGSSMGAFGAIATAARWPQARVMAFAPDFAIGEPGSQSAAAGLALRPGEGDIADLLAQRGPTAAAVDVIIGLFDAYDASVAARLHQRALPGLHLVTLRSSHELHDHLYSVNVIRKVIMTFARDIALEAAARGLVENVANFSAYETFDRLDLAHRAGQPVEGADLPDAPAAYNLDGAALEALSLDGNPGLELLRADVAAGKGAFEAAIGRLVALEARITADPALASLPKRYLKTVPRRLIAWQLAAGFAEAARQTARDAQRRYPTDATFARLAAATTA